MLTIKKATKNDVDNLYNLITGIAKHHQQEQFVITTKEELLKAGFEHTPKFESLLAYWNDQVAGYVSYTWNYSIWLGQDYMNIDDVFVWEEFRGHKIGEALMLKAKEICEEQNVNRIRWEVQADNIQAIKFYKRLGAEMTEKGIFRWTFAS